MATSSVSGNHSVGVLALLGPGDVVGLQAEPGDPVGRSDDDVLLAEVQDLDVDVDPRGPDLLGRLVPVAAVADEQRPGRGCTSSRAADPVNPVR